MIFQTLIYMFEIVVKKFKKEEYMEYTTIATMKILGQFMELSKF